MAFEREYFSPDQAADHLGVPLTSVQEFIRTGKLRASNLGKKPRKRWVISRKNLEAFVESMAYEGQHSCVATAGEGAE
jgi:excisionase family DNA binding protein